MAGGSTLIYLFAAYLVIWVVLSGYVLYVSQQVGDLRAQVRALRRDRTTRAEG
jgi:CcmD family protein